MTDAPHPLEVILGSSEPDIQRLRFRDPNCFVAGSLNGNPERWQELLDSSTEGQIICSWLKHGVQIPDFFRPFKGVYRNRSYDLDEPPDMYFANAPVCRDFVPFINETIIKRLTEGSVERLGRTNDVSPPRCVNAQMR